MARDIAEALQAALGGLDLAVLMACIWAKPHAGP